MWRVFNQRTGMWETDRTAYYRERFQRIKHVIGEKRNARSREYMRDPVKRAVAKARRKAQLEAIVQATRLCREQVIKRRRAIRLAHDDIEERLKIYAEFNLLTKREKAYLEKRKPLRKLPALTVDDKRELKREIKRMYDEGCRKLHGFSGTQLRRKRKKLRESLPPGANVYLAYKRANLLTPAEYRAEYGRTYNMAAE